MGDPLLLVSLFTCCNLISRIASRQPLALSSSCWLLHTLLYSQANLGSSTKPSIRTTPHNGRFSENNIEPVLKIQHCVFLIDPIIQK